MLIIPGKLGLVATAVWLHNEAGQREGAALCDFQRQPFLHLPAVAQAAFGLNVPPEEC